MLRGGPNGAPAALARCQAGGLSFCLDLAAVARIERSDRLRPGPGADGPAGFLDSPGGRLPAWSLARRLGLPEAPLSRPRPVLVLRGRGRLWGLVVERVGRAAGPGGEGGRVALSPLPPLAGDPGSGWFKGVAHLADGLALHLDPERLHPEAEPADGAGPPAPPEPVPAAASPAGTGSRSANDRHPGHPGKGRLVLFSTSPGGGTPIRLGLSLSQVVEVGRPQPLLRVPGSGASFLGLARHGGEALPVLDLQLHLGAGPSFFEGASRLLVARGARSPQLIGFPVRPEVRLAAVPEDSRAAEVPGVEASWLRGLFATAAGTILVPDIDRILSRP